MGGKNDTKCVLCDVIEYMERNCFSDSFICVEGGGGEIEVTVSGQSRQEIILEIGLVCGQHYCGCLFEEGKRQPFGCVACRLSKGVLSLSSILQCK
jgi:hypothetical protein